MTNDDPICVFCMQGTDEKRLVISYVRKGREFYAHEACASRAKAKATPPDPLVNRRRRIPTLSESLRQWNGLVGELTGLIEELRSAPRVRATADAACDAINSVSWRTADTTWALGDQRSDEADDQVRTLRWHLDKFRAAIKRDPMLRGRRSPRPSGDLSVPDLRLPATLTEVLAASDAD